MAPPIEVKAATTDFEELFNLLVGGPEEQPSFSLNLPGLKLLARANSPDLREIATRAFVPSVEASGPSLDLAVFQRGHGAPWPMAPARLSAGRGTQVGGLPPGFEGAFSGGSGTLTLIEPGRSRAVVLAEAEWHQSDRATPFAALLSLVLPSRGRALLHAAAFAGVRGALLIPASGGAGKSTTSLLAGLAGYGFMGDDYCALRTAGAPVVEAVYRTVRLERNPKFEIDGFGAANADSPNKDPKHLFFLESASGLKIENHAPLAALLIPAMSHTTDSRLEPIRPRDAVRLASASSIFGLPGAPEAVLSALANAASQAPCFHLFLGTDPRGALEQLARLSPPC